MDAPTRTPAVRFLSPSIDRTHAPALIALPDPSQLAVPGIPLVEPPPSALPVLTIREQPPPHPLPAIPAIRGSLAPPSPAPVLTLREPLRPLALPAIPAIQGPLAPPLPDVLLAPPTPPAPVASLTFQEMFPNPRPVPTTPVPMTPGPTTPGPTTPAPTTPVPTTPMTPMTPVPTTPVAPPVVPPPASLLFQEPTVPPVIDQPTVPPVIDRPAGPPPASLWFQEPAPSPADPDTLLLPPLTVPTAPTGDGAKSAWLTNPPVSVIPRPGFFAVPPTGPGYYSWLDMITGKSRENPPTFGYPRSAIMIYPNFDTDWRYVDQPGYDPDMLERLHRIHIGDNWLFATGGEFRDRWSNEVNSRLTGKDNSYDLTRLRVYGDLWYRDIFRVYAEFISAQSFWQDLPPLIIDRNYADLLNAFIDLKVFEDGAGVPWYVRGGRQQMLFGSQRLISPLDWANTMRTFDGVRAFRHSESLDIDAFWTRVVIPNASRFDTSDPQQNFAGAWMEYRPTKNQALDLYYLYLANNDRYNAATKTPAPVGQLPEAPYTVHTLGYRYAGNLQRFPNVLFDWEDMLQFGRSSFTNSDIVAGQSSTGLGYNFAKAPMNPTVWAYFDYASGSRNINMGQQFSTFNQLYPFGHYYFGWLDYVGRDNIEDLNFHLYLYPTKWITFNTQYHIFALASAKDALYSAGGTILRYDPTGRAGRNIGSELDFIVNFHLTARQDILAAYGHLFEGSFLRNTGPGTSAETFWLMYNVRW